RARLCNPWRTRFQHGDFELRCRRRWQPLCEIRRIRRELRVCSFDDNRRDLDVLRLEDEPQLVKRRLKRDALRTRLTQQWPRGVLVLKGETIAQMVRVEH